MGKGVSGFQGMCIFDVWDISTSIQVFSSSHPLLSVCGRDLTNPGKSESTQIGSLFLFKHHCTHFYTSNTLSHMAWSWQKDFCLSKQLLSEFELKQPT